MLTPRWIRSATVGLLVLGATGSLRAQAQANVDSVNLLSKQANEASELGTRDGNERAIVIWRHVIVLYRRLGDRAGEATMLTNVGSGYRALGQTDSALAYYASALPIQRARDDRSGEATTLSNIGVLQRTMGRSDSALIYYTEALRIQSAVGNRSGEATTLNNIGVLQRIMGRSDSALVYYAAALRIERAVGNQSGVATTLNNIGRLHSALGRPDSALAYYDQALLMLRAAGDRSGEAATLTNVGNVQLAIGRPDSALVYYTAALQIGRAVGNRSDEATALYNIGRVHSTLGRRDSALVYYADALRIERAVGDQSGAATTLNNIGLVHADLGRADSALFYYAEALRIKRAVGNRSDEATTLDNIGREHSDLGRPDSAFFYYTEALRIKRAVGDRSGEAVTLTNIGNVYLALGGPDSAPAYYALALPLRRAVGDGSGLATTLTDIGLVQSALRRPRLALVYDTEALRVKRAAGDRSGVGTTLNDIGHVYSALRRPDSSLVYYGQALPIRRALGDRSGEAETLNNIGFEYQYRVSPRRPRVAVAYYDSAAAALVSVAAHAGGDQNRLSFDEQDVNVFRLWTLAWLSLRDEVGPQESALAALAATERGRAQALLALMRRSSARGSVGARAASTAAGTDLIAEGRRFVRAATRGGSSALSYLVTRDTLLIWLVGPRGEVEVFRSHVTEQELATEVAALRRGLGAGSTLRGTPDLAPERSRGVGVEGGADSTRAAARLAEWLLPAALRAKLPASGELVIVSHGPLNLVPFAALPVDIAGDLLGIRYSIRYSPSLATLEELGQTTARNMASVRSTALVVGNPAMPRVRGYSGAEITLASLPGAEAEGRWVAGRLGAPLLHGAAATEAEVKRRLPGASLVHLASHGYAYSSAARARDSFIALAPTAGEDGLLTVGEVLDALPSLSAELVVLSACQTGLGDLKQAEGTVGLQRAFLAKGARSVLVSLWSVSDEATEQLMKSFYTHWLGGDSKSEALRKAQQELRGKPASRFYDPRYWAGFQLVGAR